MSAINKRYPFLLFCGDIVIFYFSLWLSLLIRYRTAPDRALLELHFIPFSVIFVVWLVVLFIAGLYEKRALVLRRSLPGTVLKTQLINSSIAVLFFYFIPAYGITPKTILFIYLVVCFVFLLAWRMYGYVIFGSRQKQQAFLIASGNEMRELRDHVNSHEQYNLHFISSLDTDDIQAIDFQKEVVERIYSEHVSLIAVDFKNSKIDPILVHLYNLIFSGIVFIDMHKIYEDVFDRIPLSLIKYSWFLENISLAPKRTYDFFKRIMDIIIAVPAALFVTIIVYPVVWLVMKFDEGKGLLSIQERVGQNNKIIKMYKFRTMTVANDGGKWGEANNNKVTKIGAILRKSRIDELPQLWNVVFGDVSLIGPRPEFFEAVKQYEQEIPYYGVRHLIKPGLSGWAQIYHDNHPHHGIGIEQTKEKLSYDLYYLKNRSFLLDVTIALKTIKKIILIKGK